MVSNAGGCNSPVTTNNLTVNPIPVINAGTDRQISTGASVNIDASISTSPTNISYLWTPATSLSSATVLNPVATPSADITYTLRATDNNTNCFTEDSVKIIVISKLFIPNAFSPNGDGLNDTWKIPAMVLYPDATVSIFNRYGEIIYETKNYISNPWNGSYRGKQQPNGTYVYIIRFAADKYEKGTVTIVR
jgi:gliding motility-associated-like protein